MACELDRLVKPAYYEIDREQRRSIMKTTVTHVRVALFAVFSVLVSSSWAAKFTDKDVSGNRYNGTLEGNTIGRLRHPTG